MQQTFPASPRAALARDLVTALQRRLTDHLEALQARFDTPRAAKPVSWLRDEGRHGGGTRQVFGDTAVFDRASVNVSIVHYDDVPTKRLGSATALSAIVHPANPHAPSMHTHISWTELKDGRGSWRIMADLNPSIVHDAARDAFDAALSEAAGPHLERGRAQGDRYFSIPALGRHRGVSHFYLEGFATEDPDADRAYARRFGETMLDAYAALVADAFAQHPDPTQAELDAQRAYHTLYLFQVLTLDRGTTSGLLVHDQNDAGIMGSLPSCVDRALLASWAERAPSPQDDLVRALVAALPDTHPSPVTLATKLSLAATVRAHYRAHPEALALQARGDVLPPTVQNHR
jgi:coproporphyrinogen III oxidase